MRLLILSEKKNKKIINFLKEKGEVVWTNNKITQDDVLLKMNDVKKVNVINNFTLIFDSINPI